jgi:cytochrome b involved in lipid metabolism
MRPLFVAATVAFWLALLAIGGAALLQADDDGPPAQEALITPDELARHDRATDCWMAIAGSVYDVSAYLPEHPSPPEIVLPWCGREATAAYFTKMRDRPHSPRADALLAQFRIGRLKLPAAAR